MMKGEESHKVQQRADEMAEERLLDLLLPSSERGRRKKAKINEPLVRTSKVAEGGKVE